MGEKDGVISKLFTKNHIMVTWVWSTLYKIYFIIAKNTVQFLSMQVICF
jgi:hypothetical protein